MKENLDRRIVIIAKSKNSFQCNRSSKSFLPSPGEKPKIKEEVVTLGEEERKIEQKKVLSMLIKMKSPYQKFPPNYFDSFAITRLIIIMNSFLLKVTKLFMSSLPITADIIPFVGFGGEEVEMIHLMLNVFQKSS